MQELLQALELRVRSVVKERESFMHDRDSLAMRVLELEEEILSMRAQLVAINEQKDQAQQDSMLASMLVEDIIVHIDTRSQGS